MCGDLITQNRFLDVGSGTGPETLAPVRSAASTICPAELVQYPVLEGFQNYANLLLVVSYHHILNCLIS